MIFSIAISVRLEAILNLPRINHRQVSVADWGQIQRAARAFGGIVEFPHLASRTPLTTGLRTLPSKGFPLLWMQQDQDSIPLTPPENQYARRGHREQGFLHVCEFRHTTQRRIELLCQVLPPLTLGTRRQWRVHFLPGLTFCASFIDRRCVSNDRPRRGLRAVQAPRQACREVFRSFVGPVLCTQVVSGGQHEQI
jgi:hypothetical protein